MAIEHVDTILERVIPEIQERFRQESQEWPLVKRNLAIRGHNRNVPALNAMLGTEFEEMPLERPEEVE